LENKGSGETTCQGHKAKSMPEEGNCDNATSTIATATQSNSCQ